MISINSVKVYCSEPISNIENYNQAINDEQKWVCHHKLEIQDGVSVSINELKKKGLYYHRPANELIFMTESEHKQLHNKHMRQETREAISKKSKAWHNTPDAQMKCLFVKGKHPWNYGLPSPMKGIKKSPETIQKMKDSKKKWWENHIITEEEHQRRSQGAKKVPPLSQEKRKELSDLYKGKHWVLIDGKRKWLN